MKEMLLAFDFDIVEATLIENEFLNMGVYNISAYVILFNKYRLNKFFIKEIILKRKDLFLMDKDRLEYVFDAIISNGDIIEETLLDII